MKTIANELNELAYKMTGVNPQAKTDAQAVDFIERNYNGGSVPSNVVTTDNIGDYAITQANADSKGIATKDYLLYNEAIPFKFVNRVLEKNMSYIVDDEETIGNLNDLANVYRWLVKDGIPAGNSFNYKPLTFIFLDSEGQNDTKVYKALYSGEIEGQTMVFDNVTYSSFNKLIFNAFDYYVEFYTDLDEQYNEVWKVKKYEKE